MVGIGIDIGSTATKLAVLDEGGELAYVDVMPTGFSSVEAAERAREALLAEGFDVGAPRCAPSPQATAVSLFHMPRKS